MKSSISSLALFVIVASANGAAAADTPSSHLGSASTREILANLSGLRDPVAFWDWPWSSPAGPDPTPAPVPTPAVPAAPAGGTQNLPTPPPAGPAPTTPAPAPSGPLPDPPAPAPDDNGLPALISCSFDAAMAIIADEATCLARQDSDGGDCVWCGVSFLDSGACITSDMESSVGFLCSLSAERGTATAKEGNYLRGKNDEIALEDHL